MLDFVPASGADADDVELRLSSISLFSVCFCFAFWLELDDWAFLTFVVIFLTVREDMSQEK